MNRIKKRWLFLLIGLVVTITYVPPEARAEKRIGILKYTNESRFIESQRGIMDQLKKDGFGEAIVKFTIETAGGSKMKAGEIAQKFSEAKMDLVIAVSTSAAIAVTKVIKDVPVVFSTVYDPIEAGIAKGWKSSGNNTTGSSTRIPMAKVVKSLKDFAPVKKLAVLYTPGEKNSELQLIELQKIQESSQIRVIPVILSKEEDVALILPQVVDTVEAFYLTGSSIVGATVPIIVEIAKKPRVATISHLDDLIDKGALLGVCVDSYHVGRLAGEKAVKVLKGAKPSSLSIETPKTLDVVLNMKTAKAGQFQIPSKFRETVTRTRE
jgi:putative ABC transport system substrate-binding protein